MTVKFSIGIPAFKCRFLDECITSILNQTFKGFELIIINDCSPEPIKKIVNQFQDRRIKYFENEKNIGAENVVNNWNRCLEKSTGEFFILMGDDDKIEPEYLEEFLKLITKYPELDIYHCRSKIIDEESNLITFTHLCPEFETVYENIWHRIEWRRRQFISDFVYRTSTLKANGGFFKLPLAWASDDISSYIACGTKGIAHLNKAVFNYRQNRINITNTGSLEMKLEAILLQEKWLKSFLLTKPCNEEDLMIYTLLKERSLYTYSSRVRRELINKALKNVAIRTIIKWWINRDSYDITIKDFIAGTIGRI